LDSQLPDVLELGEVVEMSQVPDLAAVQAAQAAAPADAHVAPVAAAAAAAAVATPAAPPPRAAPAASGLRVLVIDDSNTIRRSAEIFLRQGGHEVLLAEDGFDALSKVNDHAPTLIFCDILMPRLDGYQTCAIIKRNPRFAHVPVIMLSSKDGLFDKARGRMVGSQDYLTKPFTKEQLLRAVQACTAAPATPAPGGAAD
jgi:twitching motility two-component system response regulator PilG